MPPAGRPGPPRVPRPGRATAPGAWPRRGSGAGVVDVRAEPAVQMLRGLHDPAYTLRRPDLGDGDVTGGGQRAGCPRGDPPRGLPQRGLHRAQVDVAVGGLHGDGLEGGDREPELLPLARVLPGHPQHALPEPERQRARPGGQQVPQPLPRPVGVDHVPGAEPDRLQPQLAEPLTAGGELLGEGGPGVRAGHQGQDGPAGRGVGGHDRDVRVVGPRHGRLHPVQHPDLAVLPCGHGQLGRVVAGTAVRGDGQHDLAPAGPGEQGGLRLVAPEGLDGRRRRAALQQRHPGQHPRRLPQHQAQRDGVQAGPAVPLVEQQAQQVRVGEPGPQGAVVALGDGAGGERGAGHGVRGDPGEHALRRLGRRLLLLGEGEVHGACPSGPIPLS